MPRTRLPALSAASLFAAGLFAGGLYAGSAAAIPPIEGDEARVAGFPCDLGDFANFPPSTANPFSAPFLASPSWNSAPVPRNVALVLGGDVGNLEFDPPLMEVQLVDALDRDIPFVRTGHIVRPQGLLAPFTTYRLFTRSSPACEGCFPEQGFLFETGQLIDSTRPTLRSATLVQAFVVSEEEQFCGMGKLILAGRVDDLSDDVTRISVAINRPSGVAQRVVDLVTEEQATAHFQVPLELQVALHDSLFVAITPIDQAGNVGVARTMRVRVRDFNDARTTGFLSLDERQCDLPDGPRLALPDVIPTNAQLLLELPLEPVPLALTGDAGEFALIPTEHLPAAQLVESIEPLPAGALLDVITLPCPACSCPGCGVAIRGQVRVADGPDEAPPALPVVLDVVEDLDPPAAASDTCYADRTALVMTLAAGSDDTTPAAFLRYDVTVRQEGELAVTAGRALTATELADGSVVVRLDTAALGRLLPQPLEFVVGVTDLGGNRSQTTYSHDPEFVAAGGCSATATGHGAPVSLALLALLALVTTRRRRY